MKKFITTIICLFACVVFNHDTQGCQLTTPVDKVATKPEYNPLRVSQNKIKTLELTIKDKSRQREIPLRVYLPRQTEVTEAAEIILFSHGLGGSRETSKFLGQHWAERGYMAVFMQHPGSDDSIWKGLPLWKRPLAFKQAVNSENFNFRVGDVPVVIDQLEKWNLQADHPLHKLMNTKKIGMSGHSFGAITAQYLSGEASSGRALYADDRIKACMAMSPYPPGSGDLAEAFGKIKLPWLLMTGSKDTTILGDTTVEDRLAIYQALPPKDKYELFLFGAEHAAFSDSEYSVLKPKRNPNHHQAIKAISTAFWDAYLKDDAAAKKWLTSDAVRSVLENLKIAGNLSKFNCRLAVR